MTGEKLAQVIKADDGLICVYNLLVGGKVLYETNAYEKCRAEYDSELINTAADAWRDEAVREAVEKERLLCADFVRTFHGQDVIAKEIERRPEIEKRIMRDVEKMRRTEGMKKPHGLDCDCGACCAG